MASTELGDTILAAVTRNLVSAIDGKGADRSRLLEAAGLSEQAIADPDDWVPIALHVKLGHAILAALPGQNLGLQTGASIFGDPRGALGYVLRRSQTCGAALQNFCRYLQVVNRSMQVELGRTRLGLRFALNMVPELGGLGHPAEALFAAWVSISRHLTGSNWRPLEVRFIHQAHGDTAEHREFFGCGVFFERDVSVLELFASAAELPIAPVSHDLEQALPAALASVRGTGTADADVIALTARLQQVPLEVSGLGAEIGLAARLRLARALLENSELFVHEVAYLLGFDGVKNFEQVFVERFDVHPRKVRKLGGA